MRKFALENGVLAFFYSIWKNKDASREIKDLINTNIMKYTELADLNYQAMVIRKFIQAESEPPVTLKKENSTESPNKFSCLQVEQKDKSFSQLSQTEIPQHQESPRCKPSAIEPLQKSASKTPNKEVKVTKSKPEIGEIQIPEILASTVDLRATVEQIEAEIIKAEERILRRKEEEQKRQQEKAENMHKQMEKKKLNEDHKAKVGKIYTQFNLQKSKLEKMYTE